MFGIDYIHKSNTLQFPHGLSIWDLGCVDLGFWVWDALVPTISYNPLADIVLFWSSRPSKLHQISRFSLVHPYPRWLLSYVKNQQVLAIPTHRQELKSAESCRPFPMGTAGRFKVSASRVAVRAHPELRGKANKDFLGANVWGSSGDSLKISGVDKSSRDV